MLVNIWRSTPEGQFFLAAEEAHSRKGKHFVVFPGACHSGYRKYRAGKYKLSKSVFYYIKLDK